MAQMFTEDHELQNWLREKLTADVGEEAGPRFATEKPMLAHYTSLQVIEQILTGKELWFSNPLFMNDHAEVIVALKLATQAVLDTNAFDDLLSPEALLRLRDLMKCRWNDWTNDHLLDLFVFSTSYIEEGDNDGELSMWRGYGGDGSGAAIVFDTSNLTVAEGAPLIVSKVTYMSAEEQQSEAERLCTFMADLIRQASPSLEQMPLIADYFFERIKVFALLTKHKGFKEEKEWRVIYLPERDEEGVIKGMIGHVVGEIVQPKLKFKLDVWAESQGSPTRLLDLIDKIILGPAVSSAIFRIGFMRVARDIAPTLENRIFASSIPYRRKIG